MHEVESITRGEVFQMIAIALYSDNAEGNQRIRELGFSEKTITAYEYALYVTQPYTYFSLPEAASLSGSEILGHTVGLDKDRFTVSEALYNTFTEELQTYVDDIMLDYQYYLDVNQLYVYNQDFSRLQRYDYTAVPLDEVDFPVLESSEGSAVNDRDISEIYVAYGGGFETYLILYLNSEKNQCGYIMTAIDDSGKVIAYYVNDDYGYYRLR